MSWCVGVVLRPRSTWVVGLYGRRRIYRPSARWRRIICCPARVKPIALEFLQRFLVVPAPRLVHLARFIPRAPECARTVIRTASGSPSPPVFVKNSDDLLAGLLESFGPSHLIRTLTPSPAARGTVPSVMPSPWMRSTTVWPFLSSCPWESKSGWLSWLAASPYVRPRSDRGAVAGREPKRGLSGVFR